MHNYSKRTPTGSRSRQSASAPPPGSGRHGCWSTGCWVGPRPRRDRPSRRPAGRGCCSLRRSARSGTASASAERLARRRGWPRQVGNGSVVRVLVPLAEARNASKLAASGVAPATAVPPDDGDDDRERLQTLESAITALREQIEYAQSGLIAERQRAERVERQLEIERQSARGRIHALQASLTEERRRVGGLYVDLADARTAAMITGCEAAALRGQLD